MSEEKKSRLQTFLWSLLVLFFVFGVGAVWYFTSPGFLAKLLASDNVQNRRWAADEMVSQGEGAGKAALETATNPEANLEARRLAIFVLGEIRYRVATPQLLAFFKGDNPTLREQSAYALGRIGDASVAPELIGAYETAPKGLRIKIIAAMGELVTEQGMELLKREATSGTDETIRDAANYALKVRSVETKKAGTAAR